MPATLEKPKKTMNEAEALQHLGKVINLFNTRCLQGYHLVVAENIEQGKWRDEFVVVAAEKSSFVEKEVGFHGTFMFTRAFIVDKDGCIGKKMRVLWPQSGDHIQWFWGPQPPTV